MATTSSEVTITVTEQERAILVNFLEQAMQDTHAEARRTESPRYQEVVHEQEALLRGLINKLSGAAP